MNWMKAPADKFVKHSVRILEQHALLPYSINKRNTVALLTDVKNIKFHTDTKYLPFDIKQLYTNILLPLK